MIKYLYFTDMLPLFWFFSHVSWNQLLQCLLYFLFTTDSKVILVCDNFGTLCQEPTRSVLVLYSPSTRCKEKIVACHFYLPFTFLMTAIKLRRSLLFLHLLTVITWTAIVNYLGNEVFVRICGIAILARKTYHRNVRMLRAGRLLLMKVNGIQALECNPRVWI